LFGAEGEEDADPAEGEELTSPTERGTRRAREPLDAAKARRMRDFFGSAEGEREEDAGPTPQWGTRQAREPSGAERRRISDTRLHTDAGSLHTDAGG
jgi:hypothetical protein